jgi:hypothetical protein
LGFAEKNGPCATNAINGIKSFAIANGSTRAEIGKKAFSICLSMIYFRYSTLSY